MKNKEFNFEELESRLEMITCTGSWNSIHCDGNDEPVEDPF